MPSSFDSPRQVAFFNQNTQKRSTRFDAPPIGIVGTVNYQQARQAFWHRHPFVTGGALLAAFWLLQHGWYLTVAIPVGVVLLISLRRRRRQAQRQRSAVQHRADFEHRLLLAGDPRGVHGRYPPFNSPVYAPTSR